MNEPITLEQLQELVKPFAASRGLELEIDELDLELSALSRLSTGFTHDSRQ